MATVDGVKAKFNQTVSEGGEQIRVRYFTKVFNAGSFDDDVSLVSGTNLFTSGMFQPINDKDPIHTNQDFLQLQGNAKQDAKVLYLNADTILSGTYKIGPGSPTPTKEYAPFDFGIRTWPYKGVDIYHKVYLRRLTNGSLIGE